MSTLAVPIAGARIRRDATGLSAPSQLGAAEGGGLYAAEVLNEKALAGTESLLSFIVF
jgi:hypothetical protein